MDKLVDQLRSAAPSCTSNNFNAICSARLAPLVKTEWDRQFVSNDAFRDWLIAQLAIQPIGDAPLVTYVQERLAAAGTYQANAAAQATEPADDEVQSHSYSSNAGTYTSVNPQATMHQPQQQAQHQYINPAATLKSSSPAESPVVARNGNAPKPPVSKKSAAVTNVASGSSFKPSPSPQPQPKPKAGPSSAPANDSPWLRVRAQVRQSLESSNLTKSPLRAASKLVELLAPFEEYTTTPEAAIPPDGRFEVLEAINNRGTDGFFRSFVSIPEGRNLLEGWTREAATVVVAEAKGKAKGTKSGIGLPHTLFPCLQVSIARSDSSSLLCSFLLLSLFRNSNLLSPLCFELKRTLC